MSHENKEGSAAQMRRLSRNDAEKRIDPRRPDAGRRSPHRSDRQKSGRGAYLCGKLSCFKLAHKSRALDRALKHQVQPEIYEQLAQDFIKVEDEFNAMKEKVDDDE